MSVTKPVQKKKIKISKKEKEVNGKVKSKGKPKSAGVPSVLKGPDGKPLSKPEARKVQKKLKEDRRRKKGENLFTTGVQAKQIWEELRREDCPKDKQVRFNISSSIMNILVIECHLDQAKLVDKLYDLVKTHVKKLVVAHDTARVIECLLARGDEKIRDALYNELKDDLAALMKVRYAVFLVQKLVQKGTKEQQQEFFKVWLYIC